VHSFSSKRIIYNVNVVDIAPRDSCIINRIDNFKATTSDNGDIIDSTVASMPASVSTKLTKHHHLVSMRSQRGNPLSIGAK
jgi:hypothetical protein